MLSVVGSLRYGLIFMVCTSSPNVVNVSISGDVLSFEGQKFMLPAAVRCEDSSSVELSMPVSALTLGEGNGKAAVQWIETIGNKTLYFLKVGDITLFSLEEGAARFAIGDNVAFDMDFSQVSVNALGVAPLCMTNTLDGIFTKEKDVSKKFYHFYMNL